MKNNILLTLVRALLISAFVLGGMPPARAARSFNGTSNFLSNSTLKNNLGGGAAMSLACWGYRANAGRHINLGFLTNSVPPRAGIYWYGPNNYIFAVAESSSAAYGMTTANTSVGWHHLCMVYDGSESGTARITLYFDSVSQPLSYIGTPPATLASAASLGNFEIGRWAPPGAFTNGAIAEAATWTAALTPAEVASLAAGFSPEKIRPGALVSYLPLIGDTLDRKGNTWTDTGTSTTTHPRVYFR